MLHTSKKPGWKMALSDSQLKRFYGRKNSKVIEKSDGNNLWVRVSVNGVVTFFYRYRFGGKSKKFTIGKYPIITLSKARESALTIARGLADGIEPTKTPQDVEQKPNYLKDVYTAYRETTRPGLKHSIVYSFRKHFSGLLNTDIKTIDFNDVASTIDASKRNAPGMIRGLVSEIKSVFRWAHRRGFIDINPIYDLSAVEFHPRKSIRTRFFTDLELVKLFHAIRHTGQLREKTQVFAELVLFFGCRPSELSRSKKLFFNANEQTWVLPPDQHKVGYKTGMSLIRAIPPECFPHIEWLGGLQPNSEFVYGGAKFDTRAWFSKARRHVADLFEPLQNAVFYDLRRTARTNWSSMTSFRSAEKMIGHMSGDIADVYDQHKYMSEMRACYLQWWNKIQRIKEIAATMTAIEIRRLSAVTLDEYLKSDHWRALLDIARNGE